MNDTWETRFVDKQVDRAWMDLRLRLADRLAAGLAGASADQIEITTATGETLTVTVDDEYAVVVAGDFVHATANIDEAAYVAFQVLHDDWQVVHPVFLDTDLVDVPAVPDNQSEAAVIVPTLGRAESREQLQAWVVATFQETLGDRLRVARNGDIPWSGRRGERVVVSVRNSSRIELWTVLGREVSFKKARKVIDRLSKEYFGLKFYLRQDVLVMSRTLVAKPFLAEHLTSALRDFNRISNRLGDVAEEALRERVKVERTDLAKAKEEKSAAQAARVEAEERARRAEGLALHRKVERRWMERKLKCAEEERDAVQTELADLRRMLEEALGRQDAQMPSESGDVA